MAVSRLHPVPHHQQPHHHHHHIASTLMSCVRESSPVEDLEEADFGSGGREGGGGGGEGRKQGRHDTKKRRFHPLRGLRRIFRRKSRRSPEDGEREVLRVPSGATSSSMGGTLPSDDRREAGMACGDLDEAYRSRSASELLSGEEDEDSPGERSRRRGSGVRTSGEIFQDSLRHSVSHDSVFSSGERRVSSTGGGNGTGGGRSPQPLAPSSSAQQVTANQGVRAELFDAVRRRRWRGSSKDREQGDAGDAEGEGAAGASAGRSSDEEEDLGLPRSPCNSPSSGEAGLRSDQKEIQSKSHSTCSEGSLLSMGSSDMDEDSQGHFSGHSSKLSLHEKSSSQYGSDLDLDVGAMAEPLSHSAARHKMAVRPKRTHGAPRLRRLKEVTSLGSLPTTPEVNEDSGRCSSPETSFNQETSSNEQLSSDNPQHSKRVSTSSSATTPAAEMPPRATHSSHQSPNNLKSDHSPAHFFPESLSPTPKSSIQSTDVSAVGQIDSHATDTNDDEFQKADVCGSAMKASPDQGGWGEEPTIMNTSVEHVEEIAGVEEHETGGTNLLSRILSWRGSKKKVEESPEGATVASEGSAPYRRMDVHGRYVHEVICETTDSPPCGATEQTPPSPGWRPAPFSTSWPPLAHSTPRPIQMSSSQIAAPQLDKGKDPSEESSMWASVEFSGPHSLPLILQDDEMRNDRPNLAGKGQQAFSYTPGPFSVKSKTMPFTTRSEAPNEVTLLKSSSLKAYRPEQNNIFYSTNAPESLPVQLERTECHFTVPSEEPRKVEMSKPVSMGTPPRESVLKSSVEGLLTLDLGGEAEMMSSNMAIEDDQGGISADDEGTADQSMEDWGEGQRDTDEEVLLSSYDSIEEKGVVESVESIEPMVTLRHTNKEPEIEQDLRHSQLRRNEDSLKRQGVMEGVTPQVKTTETAPLMEEQTATTSSTPMSGASRYKRTQSMPNDSPMPKSSDVPEFLRVQLIHVDSRPTTNVVLHSTGGVPVSVNPPETSDTPGRRRMRPRSADSMERSRTESGGSQTGNRIGGGIVESSSNSSIGSDKVGSSQRIRVASKESLEAVQQSEVSQPNDTPVPMSIQKKLPEVAVDKEVSEVVAEKETKGTVQPIKALSKESVVLASTPSEPKEASVQMRRQRKVSDEMSNRGSVASVVSVKEKEDIKPKPLVRESLGSVVVQNDVNKPKEATLPPRALRKVSGDEVLVEVVPRRKSTSAKEFGSKGKDDEPELFKVFARRSLKLKDSDSWENHPPPQQQKSRDSDKENDSGDNAIDVVILPVSKEQKQRDSLIKAEFIRDTEHSSKASVSQPGDIPHNSSRPLQRIPSSNGIVPPVLLNTGNSQNNSVYGGSEKTVGIVSETPKHHRASVTGSSLQRREGPSPEKRPRGISINLPPESQPIRVEMNRVVGIPFEPRRPSWAAQMHSDESFVKPVASDMSEVRRQPVELGMDSEEDTKPHFKRIQQRKEEWELRARMK